MSLSTFSKRSCRVSRSRNSVTKSAGTVPPDSVISVRMRNTSKSTFTRSATACSCPYSITMFCSKKATVWMPGVAVSPTRNASKYSSTWRHTP